MADIRRNLTRAFAAALLLVFAGSAGWGMEGRDAPAFTLEAPDGSTMSLPEQREGVDICFFWATWCAFCNEVKPQLQAIVDAFGDDVRVINFREDERAREAVVAALP